MVKADISQLKSTLKQAMEMDPKPYEEESKEPRTCSLEKRRWKGELMVQLSEETPAGDNPNLFCIAPEGESLIVGFK